VRAPTPPSRCRRRDTFGGILRELELELSARGSIELDEAQEVLLRMRSILAGLDVEHRRELHLLAPLERQGRVSLDHRVLGLEEREMRGNDDRGPPGIDSVPLHAERVPETREGVDHGPDEDDATHGRFVSGDCGRRDGCVARVVRTHAEKRSLVATARISQQADKLRARPEARRVRLHPAHRVVGVRERCRIGRHGRHPKIDCDDADPRLRQAVVDLVVHRPIGSRPASAVNGDESRHASAAPRPKDASRQSGVTVPEVLDVLDRDLIRLADHCESSASPSCRTIVAMRKP
jgi:hypothetical protein